MKKQWAAFVLALVMATGCLYPTLAQGTPAPRVALLAPEIPAVSLSFVCGGGSVKQVEEILAVLEKYRVKAPSSSTGCGWRRMWTRPGASGMPVMRSAAMAISMSA